MSDLLKINVNDHTEKKGELTYLSWAWAWAEVLKHDPKARYEVRLFDYDGRKSPVCWIGETALVCVEVVINGLSRECWLPAMDNRNNAVKNPDARKVSDAIMRCMTKAVALHGLGLYIYAGEDLPQEDDSPVKPQTRPGVMGAVLAELPELSQEDAMYYKELASTIEEAFANEGAAQAYACIEAEQMDSEQKLHLWSRLGSKVRSALKAQAATKAQ